MFKLFRVNDWSITTKLLGVMLLILVAVGGIATTNILISQQVEQTLVPLIHTDVKQIIQNAALTREITAIIAQVNFLANTFVNDPAILQTTGKDVIQQLSGQENGAAQKGDIQQNLTHFRTALQAFLDQCQQVVHELQQLKAIEGSLDQQLATLDQTVTMQLLQAKTSGMEYEIFAIEQVSAATPDFKNALLQVRTKLAESTRGHLNATPGEETYEAPIISMLADLLVNLQPVATAGKDISQIGKQLIEAVQQYQDQIQTYHDALRKFQDSYQQLNAKQTQFMGLMETIDAEMTQSTTRIQGNITSNLQSSRQFTFVLSLLIIVMTGFVGFVAFRMFRPIVDLARIAQQLSTGDIQCAMRSPRNRDEIGQLFLAFQQLIAYLQANADVAEKIAHGDLSAMVTMASAQDVLGKSFTMMTTTIRTILEEIQLLTASAGEGNLNLRGNAERFDGEYAKIINGINRMLDTIIGPLRLSADHMSRMAEGDVPAMITEAYQGDFNTLKNNLNLLIGATETVTYLAQELAEGNLGVEVHERSDRDKLMQALNAMLEKLNSTVIEVKTAAKAVASGSQDLNLIAEQLSQATSQQAAAAEEVSSSMEEMASNIRQNADNARVAERMALESAINARQGGEAVGQTIEAMKAIEERISIIQEIAMQTNILSMNATIEASKAQDYGKGFAVVAAEVRNLARRSREAAEEIGTLVKSCVEVSVRAGGILQHLVPNSEKTAELVQEINAASNEQSLGSEQINRAVQQLDQVIQQNAATAEEMASSAEELAAQAEQLQQAMSFFTVKEYSVGQIEGETELLHALRKLFSTKESNEEVLQAFVKKVLETSPSDLDAQQQPSTLNPPQLSGHKRNAKQTKTRSSDQLLEDLPTTTSTRDQRDEEFEHY